jgi:glutaconate CoA-transferase subunit B
VEFSTQELMIVAAAREITDGDVVFVGMRLPITAYGVARLTHAPNAVGLFECGVVRNAPAGEMLYTMGDPPNQLGAAWTCGLVQVMGLLQRGRVDAGFIGGAQIDRRGNINTSYIGAIEAPKVKLPGSGGAADIAALAKRLVVIMNHQKHRFVDQVDYVTSPGFLDGAGSREALGLGGGPSAVISDRCILRPWGPDRELRVASLHPGNTLADVQQHTAWSLAAIPDLVETPGPTAAELEALHAVDKDGFWRRSAAR